MNIEKDYGNLMLLALGHLGWFVPQEARDEAWKAMQELTFLRSLKQDHDRGSEVNRVDPLPLDPTTRVG